MSSLPINPRSQDTPLRFSEHEPPASAPAGHPGETNPLSDAHLDQIRLASKRAKPIEKAVRYAGFSGWATLLAGVLSLPFAFGDTPMLIFTIALAGIGTRELTLRRSLRSLESWAPRKLAINQLLLGSTLMIYAIFMLVSAPAQTMIESAMQADPTIQSTPELAGMMDDLIVFEQMATALIYVGMIVLAIIFQGGTALYYLRKGSKLKKFHKHTPDWVVRVYQTVHH